MNEEQCRTVQEQQCSTVQEQQCSTVQEDICRATNRQECNTVNKQVCETQYDNVCNTIQDQECTTVQDQECTTVHDQECQTVNEQQCSTVHDTVQEKAKAYMAHVMTAVTMLVVAIPEGLPMAVTLAMARELLCQAVAYNSSYSSRLEERDGLDTQGDIELQEKDKHTPGFVPARPGAQLQMQQQRDTPEGSGHTVQDEVGHTGPNGGEHTQQEDIGEDTGNTGESNTGESAGNAGDAGEQDEEKQGEDEEEEKQDEEEKPNEEEEKQGQEAVIASQGWQGGKLRPIRVRKKIDAQSQHGDHRKEPVQCWGCGAGLRSVFKSRAKSSPRGWNNQGVCRPPPGPGRDCLRRRQDRGQAAPAACQTGRSRGTDFRGGNTV